jgi:crossover junction endodeoxyribonuclease RuvC
MILAGIDPSLSATAVVLSDPSAGPQGHRLRIFGSKSLGDAVRPRFTRFKTLASQICDFLAQHRATHLYLENYAFGAKFIVTLLAEFGGILRSNLLDVGEVFEVAPATLKKFATGSGNSEKDMVAACLVQRYGVMLESTDAFDAYSAWRLGRCCMNIDEPANDAQREAVAKVMGIEIPKTKKPRKKAEAKPF